MFAKQASQNCKWDAEILSKIFLDLQDKVILILERTVYKYEGANSKTEDTVFKSLS